MTQVYENKTLEIKISPQFYTFFYLTVLNFTPFNSVLQARQQLQSRPKLLAPQEFWSIFLKTSLRCSQQ